MATTVVGLNEFLGHVAAVKARANSLDNKVVEALAVKAKRTVLETAATQIPGLKMSRFNDGKGLKLNATFKMNPGTTPTAILLPIPPGPWYLLEHGGVEHQIGRRVKRAGRRGLRGQAGFLGASGRFAAMGPVDHPPMEPKRTWTIAKDAAIARSHTTNREYATQYVKLFAGR